MKIKIIGKSVFMEFEHVAKNDKSAIQFIKSMMTINRGLALEQNPKPENARTRKRHPFRWMRGTHSDSVSPEIKSWRERNRELRLTVQIERV
jgi:hypothetical protein